ncbi:carbohydrate ABC transporter permease [Brachybacterium vulturis]|uniref:carbohydrate ABC transporter permease n=1 Tax=Brachybacterium vulturis TaxID=2017484 RepID=UPI003734D804
MSAPTTSRSSRSAPSTDTGGARRRSRRLRGSPLWPALFLAPTLLILGVFHLWPGVQTLWYSFTEWGAFGGTSFTGIANYARMLEDPEIIRSFLNTAIFTLIVMISIPIGTVLASMIERPGMRFRSLYRTLYFIPFVTMPAAVAIVWKIIFNGDFGVANWLLSLIGISGPYWLSTPPFALIAVAIVGMWSAMGFNLILLSAGVREIPRELYEAAEIDGASPLRQFFSVTVPLMTPSLFFVTIITVIQAFQQFDLIFIMLGTNNIALPETQGLVFIFYAQAFINNDKGYAAAIGILALVVIGLLTMLQFRLQKRWVHYD